MANGRPTYLWAAEEVLRKHQKPLSAKEIVTFAQNDGLFTDEMNSRTPQKSLHARISMDIVQRGPDSAFIRTGRGRFFLRALLGQRPMADYSDAMPVSFEALRPYSAPPRRPAPPTENVLVIHRSHYKKLLDFQGFKPDRGKLIAQLISGTPTYLARTDAEKTSEYKQAVTYVIITYGSKVLSFRRGVFSRAAQFLRGSSCIGFGGHVSEDDRDLFSAGDAGITQSALRELQEEIAVGSSHGEPDRNRLSLVGIINDDSSVVGQRHVAIVMRYKIKNWHAWRRPERGEASVNQLKWIDVSSEIINLSEYEYWSQICWRQFYPEVVRSQTAYRLIRKTPFQGKHLLIVVGGIGSGKSSVTNFFVSNLGYEQINSGRVLAKLMGVRPVPATSRKKFQELASEYMKSNYRIRRFASELLKNVEASGSDRVIIDGIRHKATLNAIKEHADRKTAVLYVHAAPDIAFKFYSNRERAKDTKPRLQEFLGLLNGPSELDVPNLITDADAVLYNWSGESGLNSALTRMAAVLRLDSRGHKS